MIKPIAENDHYHWTTGTHVNVLFDSSGRLSEVILKFRDLIEKLEKDVYAVLRLEKEEKEMAHSEAQVCLFASLYD